MAQILPSQVGKSKTRLHSVKVDMTPMVDLGFLLITFFIFTTTLAEPTVVKLSMPAQGPPQPVESKKLLTLLVDKQKLIVYPGEWNEALANGQVGMSTFESANGVGNIIRQKQLVLKGEKDDLMIAIKPTTAASYQDVMNALDEMNINDVKRYGIMKITDAEITYLKSFKQ